MRRVPSASVMVSTALAWARVRLGITPASKARHRCRLVGEARVCMRGVKAQRARAAATARPAITLTMAARYSAEPCMSLLTPSVVSFTALSLIHI